MKHKIEFDCRCESCRATGIYAGMGERDGFGVQCHHCKGTGKVHRIVEYEDFVGRKKRTDIKRVLRANPGIGTGENKERGLTLESFGGMPYKDWFANKPFPSRSEMRQFTCPAWWYQSADYKKKPDWDECMIGGMFSGCNNFPLKYLCWDRWDEENSP